MPLLTCLAALTAFAAVKPMGTIVGNVRVQPLSPTLVRIELKGPKGFEDRETFTVVDRRQFDEQPIVEKGDGVTALRYKNYTVAIPARLRTTLTGVEVLSPSGKSLYTAERTLPKQSFLPNPADKIEAYVVADSPRLVPPTWGATPAPEGNTQFPETSGWDTANDAPDLYVFVPGAGGYRTLREDFLTVFGRIPMPPKWAFGFWDSRWTPYTEKSALDSIGEYRRRGIPLDGFVVDTDWRISGSHGYRVAKKYFPDMRRFIKEAHAKNVHLMFNDHPEPVAASALDPKEFAYRWQGLTSLLKMGMDVWWYDRNWSTHLHEPMPGISKEVWGQRVFHDVTLRQRPKQRPLIMSNVEGIDNGILNGPPHPAGHRYPITWTGDTGAYWIYLNRGIANGVDSGVNSLLPYVNEDLGGHWSTPTPELYVRFIQYGAFSPIMRVHCTLGQDRHPWAFGPEAEAITRDYVKMRYRLLPTLYSAARRAYDDGTPIMRRGDLEWPGMKGSADDHQFLFGDDILVAPMNSGKQPPASAIPAEMLHTDEGSAGLKGEYFDNADLKGKPKFERVDSQVAFDWSEKSPQERFPRENFSVRWTGSVGPIPDTGDFIFGAKTDDGVRLWIDGKLVIDQWIGRPTTEDLATVHLEQGKTYAVKMEYMQLGGAAEAQLGWVKPSDVKKVAEREFWLPPGDWQDAWTGETLTGPQVLRVSSELWHTPLYVRRGGLLFLAPDSQHTTTKPDDVVTIDAYVPVKDGATERTLYEDDGISNGYLKGEGSKTVVRMTRSGDRVKIEILPAQGRFKGALAARKWVLRVHTGVGNWPASMAAMPFASGDAPGQGVDVCELSGPVTKTLTKEFLAR